VKDESEFQFCQQLILCTGSGDREVRSLKHCSYLWEKEVAIAAGTQCRDGLLVIGVSKLESILLFVLHVFLRTWGNGSYKQDP